MRHRSLYIIVGHGKIIPAKHPNSGIKWDTETDRDGQRQRETERDRERQTETDGDRQRQRE